MFDLYLQRATKPASDKRNVSPFTYQVPDLAQQATQEQRDHWNECYKSRGYFILRDAGWTPAQIAIMSEVRI